ncbi:response regulator transcription factor [uncultured Clostridium sp.]|uniref:response regulator transcription factor n=1 Tax=uncultured Clostridium sp. TaxID=59620 RepID=UPI0026079D06|nr:response regulator transcription factor [uncultured Clostridium sp.]
MKILVIEDDLKLKKYVKEYLEAYEYEVEIINNFNNIMEVVKNFEADLILLDINLPVFDGFYFLRLIRKLYKTPIIILSARSEEGEQIRGMELGADDYVIKPFSIGVLLAKINASLRRNNDYKTSDIASNCGITLNEESMKLTFKEDIIDLTKNEYKILKAFLSNVGKVVTREELLSILWDDITFVDDNTLTVNITRVKRKLAEIGIKDNIATKRGIGYVFNEFTT